MRNGLQTAAILAAGLAFSTPALAVDNISTRTIPLTSNGSGTLTADFMQMPGRGTFLDTFLFQLPSSGRVSVRVTSTQTDGPPTNVNFNSTNVKFNGQTLAVNSRGIFELRTLFGQAVSPGTSTLVIQGAAGALGTYTGSLAYAVPEPAMWALMILGFGVTGAALRTRRRRVSFSAA